MRKLLLVVTVGMAIGCLAYKLDDRNPRYVAGIDIARQLALKQSLVLCEQSQHRILIVDVLAKRKVWEWKAHESNISPGHIKWFDFPDEAKSVYNNNYILMTASGGGVALIRIADKKAVFYAFAGGNPHSAEILPDGNIVSSSSTGNFLLLFSVDTTSFPGDVAVKKYPISDGHNVVWDRKRQILWAGSDHQLRSYKYNFHCLEPELVLSDSVLLPDNLHDLFPAHGEDALWLTTNTEVFKLDLAKGKFHLANVKHPQNIKSVSSGPSGFPTILIHPKEKWWTDEVIDASGQVIFGEKGLKIYKARWYVRNEFSYPPDHKIMACR
jgi:hypothetical protein